MAEEPKVKIYSQEDESKTEVPPKPARRRAINWISIAIILVLVIILINLIW
jgi:uncharacterized membrane protein YvbJ